MSVAPAQKQIKQRPAASKAVLHTTLGDITLQLWVSLDTFAHCWQCKSDSLTKHQELLKILQDMQTVDIMKVLSFIEVCFINVTSKSLQTILVIRRFVGRGCLFYDYTLTRSRCFKQEILWEMVQVVIASSDTISRMNSIQIWNTTSHIHWGEIDIHHYVHLLTNVKYGERRPWY